MSTQQAISLIKQTYSRWSDHHAPRLGASVAFYSILSFAPLLVLITAIIGLVLGHESAHGALVGEARQVIGEHGARTVDSLLNSAQKPASGIFASVVAFITLLLGASGVFTELHDALNIMWDAPNQESSGFWGLIKDRLFSFGMVLSVGFLLLVSLLLSAGLAYLGHSFGQAVPIPPFVLEIVNFIVSFAVITLLFALMFKYVPSVHIEWREVIVGAIGTALLFTIGKFLLGIYLGKASVASTYGAAGSLVAVVVWIYYSAQIFFFGAEFTRVYADAQRGQLTAPSGAPKKQAVGGTAAPKQVPQPLPVQKSMAAAAGASSYSPPPASSASTRAAYAPAPGQNHPAPQIVNSPPGGDHSITVRLPKQTKPRLLAAVAAGFLIGRVTWTIARNRDRR